MYIQLKRTHTTHHLYGARRRSRIRRRGSGTPVERDRRAELFTLARNSRSLRVLYTLCCSFHLPPPPSPLPKFETAWRRRTGRENFFPSGTKDPLGDCGGCRRLDARAAVCKKNKLVCYLVYDSRRFLARADVYDYRESSRPRT